MTKYKLTKEDSTRIDLNSYSKERKELVDYMMSRMPNKAFATHVIPECTDDNVAVGPAGERSIGVEKWKKGFQKQDVTFKKVDIIPETTIIRFYNEGKTAVVNLVLNVTLNTPVGEINLNVLRLETWIKKGNQWCMVAGQGTEAVDYGDGFKTLVSRILAAFFTGLIIMYLFMRWRFNKFKKTFIKI